jgi:hypothetical protein
VATRSQGFCRHWEHSRCSFSGTFEVSYGANGKFTNPRAFTGGAACNNTTFGDPLYGTRKWCETRPASTSNPTPRPGWTFCSWENTQCSFPGTLEVSYGANGTFTAPKTFTGGTACNNTTFGDLLYGTRKWCETRPVAATLAFKAQPSATVATPSADELPANTTAPAVSGPVVVGRPVRASAGVWLNKPTAFRYMWSRCNSSGRNCTTIRGARASAYTIRPADKGRTLIATVIATNAAGSAFASSASTIP